MKSLMLMICVNQFLISTEKIHLKVYSVADPENCFAVPKCEGEFSLSADTSFQTLITDMQKDGRYYGKFIAELKDGSEYAVKSLRKRDKSRLLHDLKLQAGGYAQIFCYYKLHTETE